MATDSPSASIPLGAPADISHARIRVVFWLATATLTGAIIRGLELLAFRLYTPYFGYTIYVWGSLISVVMVALSLGYALSGWLADRSGTDGPLYAVILAGALYQFLIVLTNHWLLRSLWPWGEFTGTVAATLVIFTPPMTALAVTSPFVIRLLARAGHVGVTAGKVYALATVGSIAGTLLTSFYLVPRFGTQATLRILWGASLLVGFAGLAVKRRVALAGLLLVPATALAPAPELPAYEVWRPESAYNLVRVVRTGGFMWLALNDARFSQPPARKGLYGRVPIRMTTRSDRSWSKQSDC